MLNDRKFKVLEVEGKSGLTVGSYSRKPGYVFAFSQWNGSDESLKTAIKNKRCVEIIKKEVEKKEESKSDIKKRIKSLEKEYSSLENSESKEAIDILSAIETLEDQLK